MAPVWMDCYAPPNSRACWLTFSLLGSPLGVFIGFGITSLCINNEFHWTLAFQFMAIFNWIVALGIFISPRAYYNLDEAQEAKRNFIATLRKKR